MYICHQGMYMWSWELETYIYTPFLNILVVDNFATIL